MSLTVLQKNDFKERKESGPQHLGGDLPVLGQKILKEGVMYGGIGVRKRVFNSPPTHGTG